MDGEAAQNTNKELWRETADDYYSPSLHVTEGGGIGINVGGMVFVRPIREWHALATQLETTLEALKHACAKDECGHSTRNWVVDDSHGSGHCEMCDLATQLAQIQAEMEDGKVAIELFDRAGIEPRFHTHASYAKTVLDKLAQAEAKVIRYQAVLEGAQYEEIENLGTMSIETCRLVGQEVARLTMQAEARVKELEAKYGQ